MGSGGGSQTTQTGPPAFFDPYILKGLQAAQNLFFPGGNLLPAASMIAPFSPDTLAGMQLVEQLSGVVPGSAQSYINPQVGAATNQYPASAIYPGTRTG